MPVTLEDLEQQRRKIVQDLAALGDFQPGSISGVTRRCGKPNCHCSKPGALGHGPHFQLTRKIKGKTVTESLPSPSAVRKAEKEIAEFRRFQQLTRVLVELNQQVCHLRPIESEGLTPQEKKRPKRSSRRSGAR